MKDKKKDKPSDQRKLIFYKTNVQNNTIKPFKKQEKSTLFKIMGDISHLFGNEIPYPQEHYFNNEYNQMIYCWYIDGFFGTQNNIKFLNDIIARFKITAECKLHSFKSIPMENINPIKLKAFKGLKSLARDKLKEKYQRVETRADDYVFWCLKLYAEDLIRQDGLIIWNNFENWAFNNFIDLAKDKSTLRAKCRNIYNWYFDRNWQIGREKKSNLSKEEIMATRQEHAKKIHTKLANDTKKKVLNCITGIFKDDYKKPNGKWNISKIAKDSGTTRPTVMKYLPKETLF